MLVELAQVVPPNSALTEKVTLGSIELQVPNDDDVYLMKITTW
jgi:hypothetical protein